ncbi:MAG: hypothetical protein RR710_07225 [Oscillospiraceae bacterium]
MLDNGSRATIREGRCHIADGKGGFIICPECNTCRNCKKKESLNFTKNHPLSLDQLTTAESEDDKVMDIQDNHCDVVSDAIALTMLDELLSYLGTFENKPYSLIFQMLYDQSTIQEIAEALNKPWSTVNDINPSQIYRYSLTITSRKAFIYFGLSEPYLSFLDITTTHSTCREVTLIIQPRPSNSLAAPIPFENLE